MSIPKRPKKREGLIREELEGVDEVIYLDEDTASNFAMNLTASAVLELCDGARTPEEIAQIIAEATGASLDEVYQDVRMILEEFAAYGLIE
ncbi:MAG: PqqD family protein [Zetaproteobacteria bacterium]|nr:MAG: PqqD family protein [Zetaproteobacteria bacterium]